MAHNDVTFILDTGKQIIARCDREAEEISKDLEDGDPSGFLEIDGVTDALTPVLLLIRRRKVDALLVTAPRTLG